VGQHFGRSPLLFCHADVTAMRRTARNLVRDLWPQLIEKRSLELHSFQIHQLHFHLREWYGDEVDERFLVTQ
jgi:hypothetical protein